MITHQYLICLQFLKQAFLSFPAWNYYQSDFLFQVQRRVNLGSKTSSISRKILLMQMLIYPHYLFWTKNLLLRSGLSSWIKMKLAQPSFQLHLEQTMNFSLLSEQQSFFLTNTNRKRDELLLCDGHLAEK